MFMCYIHTYIRVCVCFAITVFVIIIIIIKKLYHFIAVGRNAFITRVSTDGLLTSYNGDVATETGIIILV